ncbi:addiction module protein [bacterium]|nr:addiction module protein [bacterium]
MIESEIRESICPIMTLAEIETWVFKLPEADRAKLAADLLDSLPGVLVEDDEGLAEALRRAEEMDRDPSVCLTHEEFLKAVSRPA